MNRKRCCNGSTFSHGIVHLLGVVQCVKSVTHVLRLKCYLCPCPFKRCPLGLHLSCMNSDTMSIWFSICLRHFTFRLHASGCGTKSVGTPLSWSGSWICNFNNSEALADFRFSITWATSAPRVTINRGLQSSISLISQGRLARPNSKNLLRSSCGLKVWLS